MNIHTVQLNMGDLLGGTAGMDAAEYGAYLSLFLASYQTKNHRLPDSDDRLARIARCTPKVWKRIRPQVMSKFIHKQEGGESFFVHERVQKEAEKYQMKSTKNKDNALKRWDSTMRPASNSQCDRIATQDPRPKTPKKDIYTPPRTPCEEGGFISWRIGDFISERGLEKAKKNAPGWDIYHLMGIYDEGVEARGIPAKPDIAFPAWCAKYTKGKSP